jgi:hypothetical protein
MRIIDWKASREKYYNQTDELGKNYEKNIYNKGISKYPLVGALFICGLILVSVVKNETRKLQKEIQNLQSSINLIKVTLHEANLDHQYITSPENIDKLAKKYLDSDFTFYKKSQIEQFSDKEKIKLENKQIVSKTEKISKKVKIQLSKKIENKKKELAKLKELYSEPNKLPSVAKDEWIKQVENKKNEIKTLYSDPEGILKNRKTQKWAALQVIKAILGIPIVPGR